MLRSNYAHRLHDFPDLVFPDDISSRHCAHWREFFRARLGSAFGEKLIFEIGCNDATFLSTIAAEHPCTAFIGLDWKCKAIFDAATRVTELGLKNVALLRSRAQDITRIFGPEELDETWIFHPDPCDRDVDLKNRLIAEPFLLDTHRVLRESGAICLKTDHAGYYQWTLSLLGIPEPAAFRAGKLRAGALMRPEDLPAQSDAVRDRFTIGNHSANFWNDPLILEAAGSRYFSRHATAFEARFRRKGWPVYYFEMRKRLLSQAPETFPMA